MVPVITLALLQFVLVFIKRVLLRLLPTLHIFPLPVLTNPAVLNKLWNVRGHE
jgi:hypothetical protein